MSSLNHQYLMIRQAGIRIVAVSQCPYDMAPTVLAQSAVVLQVGAFSSTPDALAAADALGMPRRDMERLTRLQCGEFIVRENMGRYDRLFGGMTPIFPGPKEYFYPKNASATDAACVSKAALGSTTSAGYEGQWY